MTNYEKIKAMSVEEMANLLDYGECHCCIYYNENGPSRCDMHECIEGVIKWLESEAEEDMLPEICSCGYRFEADETICPNCGAQMDEVAGDINVGSKVEEVSE